jgi:hypothetical protein
MAQPSLKLITDKNLRSILEYILKKLKALSENVGGSGVQTVSGDAVDNTDPTNPIINIPEASVPTLVEVLKSPGADNFVVDSPDINLANNFGFSDPAAKRLDLSPDGIGFYGNNTLRKLTKDRTVDEFGNYILPITGFIPGITSEVPVASGSQGFKGQMALTTTDMYICIADNTWRKVALATF